MSNPEFGHFSSSVTFSGTRPGELKLNELYSIPGHLLATS
jgi:hypothetical protein